MVEEVVDYNEDLPDQIKSVISKDKVSLKISSYKNLKTFLLK